MGAKASKLDKQTLQEIEKKTRFDSKQIQQWFKGYSKDFSSPLTKPDFVSLYKNYFPFGDATKYAQYVFRQLDGNNDGVIDFEEFMVGLDISSKGSIEERLEWSFKMFDLDEDGKISRAEMLAIVDSIYRMMGDAELAAEEKTAMERVDKIFNTMDHDQDGYLSKQEFVEGGKRDPSVLEALNIYAGLV